MWLSTVRVRVVLVHPNFIEKFIPRDHALGVLRQELQCLEFLCGDRDLLAATSDLRLEKIHRHILEYIYVFRTNARRTPDERTQTGNQFPGAERYGHVIVGTHFQE